MNNSRARVKIISETSVREAEVSTQRFLQSIEEREPLITMACSPDFTPFGPVWHVLIYYRAD